MKKITFALFALIAGTSFAQHSVNGTATVNAEVVSPLTIKSSTPLNFGTIVQGTSGTVTLSPEEGTRVFSNSQMKLPAQDGFSLATFQVNSNGYDYSIYIPDTTVKLGEDGDTMGIVFDHNLADSGNTATEFLVGGVLTVDGDEAVGAYTGTVTVTVSYE